MAQKEQFEVERLHSALQTDEALPIKRQAFMYAICDPAGNMKIGITTQPRGRLSEIQTGNPHRLEMVSMAIASERPHIFENHVHEALRLYGLGLSGEWFAPSVYTTIVLNAISAGDPSSLCEVATSLRVKGGGCFCDDCEKARAQHTPIQTHKRVA